MFSALKVSVCGVFWSAFSPNAVKYGPENSKYGQYSHSGCPRIQEKLME